MADTPAGRPLRVAVLFDTAGFQRSLPLTGAAARTLYLNAALAEAGADVTLLLCDLNPRSVPTRHWPFPVHYLPYEALYEDTGALTAQVRELEPDILVMSNTQLTVRYGRALADAGGAALVYEMHDDEAVLARTIGSGEWAVRQDAVLQATAVAAADAVVAFTPRDAELATALRARAVHVLPCGVDPGPRPDYTREQPGRTAFVGNLFYEPNARAAVFLRNRLAPTLAAVGGSVDMYGRYPAGLRKLAAGSAMRLHGPVPDLRGALATAQVGVAPLDSGGGMKLKVLQYLAAGLAVVGTPEAFAGLPDPGNFALISAHPDMADLPDLVTRLTDDQQLRRRLGNAGRRLAQCEFSWTAIAARALDAYRRTAARTSLAGAPVMKPEIRVLAGEPPYWLREWRTRQKTRTSMGETTPVGHGAQHPVLAQLATEIDCARQAAESALDIAFDQDAIVGYGGRSMVFLAEKAVLKVYTHRPAERAEREVTGLTAAAQAAGLRVPEVLGHDTVDGALAWVSATRLDGTAPTDPDDAQATATLGTTAARLHAIPVAALDGLPPFGRTIRPMPDDDHPVRHRLTTVLAAIEAAEQNACVPGFVHGDYSARNLLLAEALDPGLIDFEGCGIGCVYEDLTNLYVQNCLIGGRDPHLALAAYQSESHRLGRPTDVDTRHLLFHTARYFRWALQWAPEIDTELAEQIAVLAPRVLDGLEADGRPSL
ncbi:phosphotransferase [Uniformispora flossi]|uniref:phosphotransferase n=1 Tax=Uniformispora flossi TaxID=3390723 RepID=UPI003C2CEBBB